MDFFQSANKKIRHAQITASGERNRRELQEPGDWQQRFGFFLRSNRLNGQFIEVIFKQRLDEVGDQHFHCCFAGGYSLYRIEEIGPCVKIWRYLWQVFGLN